MTASEFEQPQSTQWASRKWKHIVIALVNPRTRVQSKLLDVNPLVMGTAHWPDRRSMAAMVAAAGFVVTRQRRVHRAFGVLIPTVVTVASRC